MYKGLNTAPKCISAVTLRFYATTKAGKQVFVILSKERQNMFEPCYADEAVDEINLLYNDLEKAANTITLSKSN